MSDHLRDVAEKIVELDEAEERAEGFGEQMRASIRVGNLSSKHGAALARAYLASEEKPDEELEACRLVVSVAVDVEACLQSEVEVPEFMLKTLTDRLNDLDSARAKAAGCSPT